MKFQTFDLPKRLSKNEDYFVTPLELKDYIDFEVKRVYLVTNIKAIGTGEHCHLLEKELFVCVSGQATAIIDRGLGKEDVQIVPGKAIYVPAYVWHGFKNLSKDLIILALSSTNYNPERLDYIEDYEEYLKVRDQNIEK